MSTLHEIAHQAGLETQIKDRWYMNDDHTISLQYQDTDKQTQIEKIRHIIHEEGIYNYDKNPTKVGVFSVNYLIQSLQMIQPYAETVKVCYHEGELNFLEFQFNEFISQIAPREEIEDEENEQWECYKADGEERLRELEE